MHLLNSLRVVPETCYSRRRNRYCVYSHLKPDRPFFNLLILPLPVRHFAQLEVLDTAGTEQFTALNEFYIKVRRHHKFLLPKPCPTQLRPLARSPSHAITHHCFFLLSNRPVGALFLSSGPYSPSPSPRPRSPCSHPGLTRFCNSLTQQDGLREVQNLREQIYRVKSTTVRSPDAYFTSGSLPYACEYVC